MNAAWDLQLNNSMDPSAFILYLKFTLDYWSPVINPYELFQSFIFQCYSRSYPCFKFLFSRVIVGPITVLDYFFPVLQ